MRTHSFPQQRIQITNKMMSMFTFDDFPCQSPNPSFNHLLVPDINDYLMLEDTSFSDDISPPLSLISPETIIFDNSAEVFGATTSRYNNNSIQDKKEVKKKKGGREHRISFRTQTEQDVMDDGFRWRKYGKKTIKNSPHLRNYYKCSSGGCQVKKRIERDREDSSYVITTYDGIHNHESPSTVYYNINNYQTMMMPTDDLMTPEA